jgi:predicted permease
MSTWGGDLRYTLRGLRNQPGFAAVAMASVALGIGVNTVIFSLVDQLLLWSIPARDAGHLVSVGGGRIRSYPFFREYRDRNQVFSSLFASSNHLTAGLRPEGAPVVEVGHVHYVSGHYFQALGVGGAAGRVIVPADDVKVGGAPVAILSYAYWQRRFAGNLNVVGRKLAVNGYPLTIAGIAEKGFGGIFNGRDADAFVPLTMFPVTTPSAARVWDTANMSWLVAMARLRPGVSMKQAQAGMQVLWPRVAEAVNDGAAKAGRKPRQFKEDPIVLAPGGSGTSSARTQMLDPLVTLGFATLLVLLIACANVANLLLSRAAGRWKEIAIRVAMGATRGRLVRQLLGESLVLAVAGGVAGLALAWWGVWLLSRLDVLNPDFRFRPSLTVLGGSAALTMLTGVLFGLAPALRASRVTLAESMKESCAASPGRSRLRLGRALVAGQVALSLALLVGAGLFLRTLRNLENADLGFRRENVVVVDIDPTNLGYRGPRLRAFYDELLSRARRIPGVRSAGLSGMTPMGNYSRAASVSAEGYAPKQGEQLITGVNAVSEGTFTTLGIPLLLGRDFRAEDEPAVTPGESLIAAIGRTAGGSSGEAPANASRICIVDETLARHFFAGGNPVGRHLSYHDVYRPEDALEIVGVVKSAHYDDVRRRDREGTMYVPSWSDGAEARWLLLRTGGPAPPPIDAVRRELRAMDPNVPVMRVRTLEQDVNANFARERLIALLAGFFGVLALGLASVGLYGVMAYGVTQRTREVGLRMALGAARGDVVRMIVRESMAPVLIGMVIGLGAALGLTRLVAGLLYGVAPRDPASIVFAVAAMLAVALAAAAIPARRASRVEPGIALRHE